MYQEFDEAAWRASALEEAQDMAQRQSAYDYASRRSYPDAAHHIVDYRKWKVMGEADYVEYRVAQERQRFEDWKQETIEDRQNELNVVATMTGLPKQVIKQVLIAYFSEFYDMEEDTEGRDKEFEMLE